MLEVKNLCKTYPSFRLDNVSFSLPNGMICGFIGQNGAGKTTTLKCIMRAVVADFGEVFVDGKEMKSDEGNIKQDVSFTTGAFDYYRNEKLCKIAKVYRSFYTRWNDEKFAEYCNKFNLDLNKRVKELSAGMKVKFSLALAMSHDAKVFIFDEPTSGLDPIARDELLDVFRDIVEYGEKSILFSTHITSDLEKCADTILFIREGKIAVDMPKDELLESHVLIKGGNDLLTDELKAKVVALKQNSFGFSALAKREDFDSLGEFVTEKPTLDDIIVYYNKEGELK
ncbi:MAG: ABC transporter ATP-binding protein [Candidatus Fimimonas sp.]